jgi:hypothetical protein
MELVMPTEWQYVEKLKPEQLIDIEKYFNTTLPVDYKKELQFCNRGKPANNRFDIQDRKECVLDYLINLEDVIEVSKYENISSLILIGTDPFGNFIGYKITNSNIGNIIFWDHESKKETFIATNFKKFLGLLY